MDHPVQVTATGTGESDLPERKHKNKGVVEVDLATPATTNMESDDDYMSDASSPDFLDTQESDVESIDGTFPSPLSPLCHLFFSSVLGVGELTI